MGRPNKAENVLVNLAARVEPGVVREVESLKFRLGVNRSLVVRALVHRGLRAYHRDGRIEDSPLADLVERARERDPLLDEIVLYYQALPKSCRKYAHGLMQRLAEMYTRARRPGGARSRIPAPGSDEAELVVNHR